MDAARARRVVRDTFQQGFDRTRFESFLRELLNRFEPKPLRYQGAYIPDAFKEHVASLERIGTYAAPGGERVDLLVVQLTRHATLARARTALRNYVAHHLKTRAAKDAALVAFVSPSEPSWRFSYVRMGYSTVTDDRGRVGTKTELTPARRLSYLVGAGESCHTAQSRFLDILQRTNHDPTIEDLEAAFSVEAVTKEFFEQYKALFLDLKEAFDAIAAHDRTVGREFAARKIDTVDFAKKLMGQIVFLYFLQKKGWLGVKKGHAWGTGPRDFIRRLTRGEFGVRGNIFNDILEPLFYDTLATERGQEAWCPRFKCRIPFLNGGLFEPLGGYDWVATDIVLPDALFTNEEKTLAGDLGTGILDVFDRYNFTVNEAEPLEIEVAIDPEMLGKVFENLLEVRERKSKGSFYTPREIVHYMCQESLINYLDGRLNRDGLLVDRPEIEALIRAGEQAAHYEAARKDGTVSYARRLPAAVERHARAIDEALGAITVCDPAVGSGAFPVGMMTELVRARTTLTPYFAESAERTPYYFKRHAIQACLYGVDIDPGAIEIAKLRLWLSLVVDEEDEERINPLPNLDFKVVAGNSLIGFPFKSRRLHGIEALKQRFFEEFDHDRKAALKVQIDRELGECLASSKKSLGYEVTFDFELYFSEVFGPRGGFDIVVANPPYIDSEAMTKESGHLREVIQASYSMTKGNWDIYIAFYEKGFRLLHTAGVLSFITPDKWISKPFGNEMRSRTTDRIFSLLKAGRSVFESVNVDAIISVFVQTPQPFLRVYDYVGAEITLKRVVEKSTLKSPYAYDWLFSDFVELLTRIDALGGRLGALADCENACATADAYKLQEFVEEELTPGKSNEYLRIINTGTIGKYVSKWGLREMVYLGARYARPVVNKKRFLEAFSNSYGRKAVKPKIILKGLNLLDACLDSEGDTIPGKTTLIITSERPETLKLLLAIVNSAVAVFYIKEKYPASSYNQGTTFTKEMINGLPIPEITAADKARLVSTIDRILMAKRADPGADTSNPQDEIDRLVYAMYGLSSAEISMVEESVKR